MFGQHQRHATAAPLQSRPAASDVARDGRARLTQVLVSGDGVRRPARLPERPACPHRGRGKPDRGDCRSGRESGSKRNSVAAILSRYETGPNGGPAKPSAASRCCRARWKSLHGAAGSSSPACQEGSFDGLWLGLGLRADGTSSELTGGSVPAPRRRTGPFGCQAHLGATTGSHRRPAAGGIVRQAARQTGYTGCQRGRKDTFHELPLTKISSVDWPRRLSALCVSSLRSQVVVPFRSPALCATLQFQFGTISQASALITGLSGLPYTRYSFLFAPPPGSVGIDWQRFFIPIVFILAATAEMCRYGP